MIYHSDDPITLNRIIDMFNRPSRYITEYENMETAMKQVCSNKGAPGADGMKTEELRENFEKIQREVIPLILEKKYRPKPVKRVYIPKPDGGRRALGIPTVTDRMVQQAIAQVLGFLYEHRFSEHSYAYRPWKSAQDAVLQVCEWLNEGYEWMVDIDISKFFDTVNQDKLISQIRRDINEDVTLHLIRQFLRAGVMENGVVIPSGEGTPQGGPLSCVLANIYLTDLDRELEKRGLHFCRYADDVIILVRSREAAERVMKSVCSWIERKLFLKVNARKTRIVRPMKVKYLGFSFRKQEGKWVPVPHRDSKKKLKGRIREITCRRKAVARDLNETLVKLKQVITGWINYYRISPCMKKFLKETGEWLRHRIRQVIIKQWKRRLTIYENLMKLYEKIMRDPKLAKLRAGLKAAGITPDYIFAQCYTRCGWYRLSNNTVVNNLLSPMFLETPKGGRQPRIGLINPLRYYLRFT